MCVGSVADLPISILEGLRAIPSSRDLAVARAIIDADSIAPVDVILCIESFRNIPRLEGVLFPRIPLHGADMWQGWLSEHENSSLA
jgi:hypothetical protein